MISADKCTPYVLECERRKVNYEKTRFSDLILSTHDLFVCREKPPLKCPISSQLHVCLVSTLNKNISPFVRNP